MGKENVPKKDGDAASGEKVLFQREKRLGWQ